MSEYRSDDEILELVKRWWKENGTSMLTAIVVGVAVIVGYRTWSDRRQESGEAASLKYDQFLEATTATAEGAAQTRTFLLNELKTDYEGTGYATLATMLEAKRLVEARQLDAAAKELEWAIANAPTSTMKDLARVRLARIQFASGKVEAAEKTLQTLSADGFVAEREELRGDMLLGKGDTTGAKAAYERAVKAMGDAVAPTLKMKLNDLGGNA